MFYERRIIMEAKRKSDGKRIEVREWRGASDVVYSTLDMNEFYQEYELDFNVDAITIDRKEYDELCKYRRYCSNWAHGLVVCPHCGEFNPDGYICANCGKDRHH